MRIRIRIRIRFAILQHLDDVIHATHADSVINRTVGSQRGVTGIDQLEHRKLTVFRIEVVAVHHPEIGLGEHALETLADGVVVTGRLSGEFRHVVVAVHNPMTVHAKVLGRKGEQGIHLVNSRKVPPIRTDTLNLAVLTNLGSSDGSFVGVETTEGFQLLRIGRIH